MIRWALAILAFALVLATGFGEAFAQRPSRLTISSDVAVLRGLDKITGRYTDLNARVGQPVKFGTLEIVVRSCRRAPPEETPETAVYLDITDYPLQGVDETAPPEPRRVFGGWMFGSSPALHALEHPVYDVWAISCRA